ncbi:MAG: 50S ribosomal protein L11 methyltransferase [Oscillospiraceae bacterium]|jgi:ribosomal protein L11 methyltransferase|nr:50S ribosomal protein L11 methyltransferase [Oscillospiraceae bacterium]
MQYDEFTLYPLDGKTGELTDMLDWLGFGYSVDDPAETEQLLELTRRNWDYFDDAIFAPRPATVKIYLNVGGELPPEVLPLIGKFEKKGVSESDWDDAWKPFWQPTPIGENLVIVPKWKTVLRLDPGMLFGTGAHATTALCLEAGERIFGDINPKKVLDLGCGSGILAIAAALWGADNVTGYDIDENAPKIAGENAALNGVAPRFESRDIFETPVSERYDLIFANIVADAIIRLAPLAKQWLNDGGRFVCSGIIAPRAEEVLTALNEAGFSVLETNIREDWYCFVCG